MSSLPPDPRLAELEAKLADGERFAALVAHELKGRLVTLERFAAGLESSGASGDSEQLRSDSARIRDIARDLIETIEALRLLDGVEPAAQASVSLHQAATEAVELLKDSLEARKVEVVIASDMPTVTGSRILWRQVFRNLIENAIQACAGVERPRIEIGCEHRDGEMTCYVRDNGCGFGNPDRPQSSEPVSGGGSGLGLLLVNRQIERHGGSMWIAAGDPGTVVNFSVPGMTS